jgi:aldehyde:ferredoxin oxidoreductase
MDIRIFEARVLSAVTGIDYSVDRLWEAGDRIYTLRRAVAVIRENRTREQDDLSPVWFERRVGTESLGEPLDRAKWEALKDRFYSLRGWNPANGRPTRSRLERLGMKGVADKMQEAGRLG